MNLAEFAVKIGFKGGKEVVEKLKGIQDASVKTKLGMAALVVAFAKMSQEARRLAMNLDIFETTTGLSGDVLERMSFKAAAAGISLENYGDTLQRVQQMTRDIALGRGDIAPFQLWGIGLNKDPIKVMDQIGARLRQLHRTDPGRAAQMARDFGLSNQMLYALLQNQTEEIEDQWLLKGKDKEVLVQLNREWYKLWWYVKQIGIRLQGFLSHTALPIVKAIGTLVKFVGEITLGFTDWISRTSWVQKTLLIISSLVLVILAYLFPLTASLIGITLVLSDIYGYFTGRDSITGRLIEWIKSGQIIKDIFLTIWEIIRSISSFIFGAKFTKKLTDFMEYRDPETGALKGAGREIAASDIVDITKPQMPVGLVGGQRNFTINQHNELTVQSTGDPVKDVLLGAKYSQNMMLNNAQMQNTQFAFEGPQKP